MTTTTRPKDGAIIPCPDCEGSGDYGGRPAPGVFGGMQTWGMCLTCSGKGKVKFRRARKPRLGKPMTFLIRVTVAHYDKQPINRNDAEWALRQALLANIFGGYDAATSGYRVSRVTFGRARREQA